MKINWNITFLIYIITYFVLFIALLIYNIINKCYFMCYSFPNFQSDNLVSLTINIVFFTLLLWPIPFMVFFSIRKYIKPK